jgi:hypothetical protein
MGPRRPGRLRRRAEEGHALARHTGRQVRRENAGACMSHLCRLSSLCGVCRKSRGAVPPLSRPSLGLEPWQHSTHNTHTIQLSFALPRDWRQILSLVNRHGDELEDQQAAAALGRLGQLLERQPLDAYEVRAHASARGRRGLAACCGPRVITTPWAVRPSGLRHMTSPCRWEARPVPAIPILVFGPEM